ncbi:chromosome partitioning protein ParA [Vibrio panuliri]|uniref:Chromosome partitioning protein ParA n=1 Tax=Vibrio panuliri TaxID=1381081 RepID=A0A1Q9HET3_9VIBR|nr:chromosome partitioning protein ParA [Vibrio panuliri]KAB1454586.1 chromosome partitioning protein ParA [Vibrio panuliri]OLQ84620.1 chromosome partitioning protein ParA [Vibrio panuliri]OLQ88245.1 chromosome partitioning protein ParA [Vibrio panuliri]
MNKSTDLDNSEDDVVVIEERDKRSYLYIAIAGVLGLALGGLVGSSMTANKWQATYVELQEQYQQVQTEKKQLVTNVEERVANVDFEVEKKLEAKLTQVRENHQAEIDELKQQIAQMDEQNQALSKQIASQQNELSKAEKTNTQLNQQADMQVSLLERSRELFQHELKVKQELDDLKKERAQLEPKLETLKKECNAYLDGTSWEAKSDSCDKQDEANSRISQINQMIRVHEMDLEQIKAISEQLGLE